MVITINVGDKKITRGIAFKPPELAEADENTFIKELCSRLAEEFPRISSQPKDVGASVIEGFLQKSDDLSDYIGETYRFIADKKITHYISSINLGAAVYDEATSTESATSGGGNVGLDPGQGGSLKIKGKASRKKRSYRSKHKTIGGDIDTVKIGSGEGVVDYELLPVSSLIHRHHANFKAVLQEAIKHYLEKESKYQTLINI